MRAKWLRRLGIAAVLLVLAAGVAVLALRPTIPPRIIGMVRTTEIKIEPEVSGRIAALPFKAGDRVSAGAVEAELSNPELAAAVDEAGRPSASPGRRASGSMPACARRRSISRPGKWTRPMPI